MINKILKCEKLQNYRIKGESIVDHYTVEYIRVIDKFEKTYLVQDLGSEKFFHTDLSGGFGHKLLEIMLDTSDIEEVVKNNEEQKRKLANKAVEDYKKLSLFYKMRNSIR